ncbi:MAG: hypothetical protein WA977_06775 [Halobacteriota archaeon]
MKKGGIATEFAVEIVKSGQYVSKGCEVEEIAKKLGIKAERLQSKDLVRVRKILSKGEPLSEIVRQHRKA